MQLQKDNQEANEAAASCFQSASYKEATENDDVQDKLVEEEEFHMSVIKRLVAGELPELHSKLLENESFITACVEEEDFCEKLMEMPAFQENEDVQDKLVKDKNFHTIVTEKLVAGELPKLHTKLLQNKAFIDGCVEEEFLCEKLSETSAFQKNCTKELLDLGTKNPKVMKRIVTILAKKDNKFVQLAGKRVAELMYKSGSKHDESEKNVAV